MKLREVREAHGLSQVQLGIKAKVAPTVISDIERGVRQPWPRIRRSLARALRVSVEELFEEAKDGGG